MGNKVQQKTRWIVGNGLARETNGRASPLAHRLFPFHCSRESVANSPFGMLRADVHYPNSAARTPLAKSYGARSCWRGYVPSWHSWLLLSSIQSSSRSLHPNCRVMQSAAVVALARGLILSAARSYLFLPHQRRLTRRRDAPLRAATRTLFPLVYSPRADNDERRHN